MFKLVWFTLFVGLLLCCQACNIDILTPYQGCSFVSTIKVELFVLLDKLPDRQYKNMLLYNH